jgi:hypothetical protein
MAKTEFKLFIISHNLLQFPSQHILLNLIANIQFKFFSIGSKFTKFGDKNDRLFFNFEKFVINEALFDQYFNKYLQ